LNRAPRTVESGFRSNVLSAGREEKSVGKSKKKAETVFLVCEETGDYNYTMRRKPGGEKLKLSKYSPRLRKHTMHTEKKK
jgi:large subunit ribosomal protein L33